MIAMMRLTLRELTRRRFMAVAAGGTALLILLTYWGISYLAHSHTRHGQPITHVQLIEMSSAIVILMAYLFSFMIAMIAVFLAAPSLAGDIESGVLLPVATRPLSRLAIVGGKTIALALVVCIYTALTGVAELFAVRAATGYLPPHPGLALLFLCLIALVMLVAAATIATRLSAIASGVVTLLFFGFAWMGGIAQSVGSFYGNAGIRDAGTLTQLLFPSDAMWRSAAFQLQPETLTAGLATAKVWTGPFFVSAPPPTPTVLWTIGWIAIISIVGARCFAIRDL